MPAGAAIQAQPDISSTVQPNISLNTNVTWNTFYNGWTPLEYEVNRTANGSLQTNLSQFYQNPISINPVNIQSKELTNYSHEISTSTLNMKWNMINRVGEHSTTSFNELNGGAVESLINSTGNMVFSMNTSAAAANSNGIGICIDTSSLPSQNMQYDYFTAIAYFSGTQITGTSANIGFNSIHTNRTEASILSNIPINEPIFVSVPLSNYAATIGYSTTNGSTNYPRFDIYMNLPETSTAATDTLTLYDFHIGIKAKEFGTEIKNGNLTIPEVAAGNLNLNTLNPDFPWTDITNNGYRVAVSQNLKQTKDYQETQTPLTGTYEEQVEYSGELGNLSGPAISFSGTNITINQNIPEKQIQILEINGVSYEDLMNATGSNKTLALLSASPGTSYSVIDITDYTTTQWQSISSPAGFFQNPTAWIEGGVFSALIVIVVVLGFKGLGKTLKGDKANEENHTRILNGKKGR